MLSNVFVIKSHQEIEFRFNLFCRLVVFRMTFIDSDCCTQMSQCLVMKIQPVPFMRF